MYYIIYLYKFSYLKQTKKRVVMTITHFVANEFAPENNTESYELYYIQ